MRRALALAMGADVVVDPARESPWKRWEDLANPHGVDPHDAMTIIGLGPQLRPGVVFECVGIPGVIAAICENAMRKARIVVAGVCMERDHFAWNVGHRGRSCRSLRRRTCDETRFDIGRPGSSSFL